MARDDKSIADRMTDEEDDDVDLGLLKVKKPIKGSDLKKGAQDARDDFLRVMMGGGPGGGSDLTDHSSEKTEPGEKVTPDELRLFAEPQTKEIPGYAPTATGAMTPAAAEANAPTGPAGGNSLEAAQRGLERVESSGNPTARNPKSSAKGLYQFIDDWDPWMKQNYGKTVSEVVDDPNLTPQQKTDEQRKMFQVYYAKKVQPWIQQVRASGQAGDYNDTQLLALYHREGPGGAQAFLKTGQSANDNTPGNGTIRDYMDSVSKIAGAGAGKGPASTEGAASTAGAAGAGKPDFQIGSAADYLGNTDTNLKSAMDMKQRIAGGGDDKFDQELAKLRGDYKDERDLNSKRELADTLAEAVGKLGAGMYGAKHNVDMSHLKFDKHDYQKDRELAQGDFRMNQQDLAQRRSEDIRKREAAADLAVKQSDLGLRTAQYKAGLDESRARIGLEALRISNEGKWQDSQTKFHQSMEEAQKLDHAEERERKVTEAKQRLKQETAKTVSNILTNKEISKDEDRAAAAQVALGALGVPADAVKEAFFKPGMLWGENVRDVPDISTRVETLIENAGKVEGSFTAVRPDGVKVKFTNAEAAKQAQAAYDKQKGA